MAGIVAPHAVTCRVLSVRERQPLAYHHRVGVTARCTNDCTGATPYIVRCLPLGTMVDNSIQYKVEGIAIHQCRLRCYIWGFEGFSCLRWQTRHIPCDCAKYSWKLIDSDVDIELNVSLSVITFPLVTRLTDGVEEGVVQLWWQQLEQI